MKRFFGKIPYYCIEKEVRFDTGDGLYLTIEAGPEGWTIIYADGGTEFKDIVDTTENNFNEAYECAKRYFPKMRKEKCNGNDVC